ncbi:MAG: hypothetical protein Q4B79_06145 [Moraxella sp.]|uniref:hypothetical protein n=1 Tax=Moraxella sp. TaxID=479 RepID=UPI0026DA73F7|nr:hypothetical protein [Moraxella sp.]MDO4450520.1 hypothetical protein [Moraxella sp.]
MNLYQTFNKLFATPKGVAQITGQKGSGVVVGQTLGGVFVVLNGQAEVGDMVYYDHRTHHVTGQAPKGERGEFGV